MIYNKVTNEDIFFRKKTFLRAYEFISGEIRPKQSEQFIKSKSKFKKPKLPSICKGRKAIPMFYICMHACVCMYVCMHLSCFMICVRVF
jgi:hypothetical protein